MGDKWLNDTSIFSGRNFKTSKLRTLTFDLCNHRATMPTPTIDLQPYKGVITSWFHDKFTANDIAKKLAIDHNIVCTARTIQRQLRE